MRGLVLAGLPVVWLLALGCGSDELRLVNRTDQSITLDLKGPRLTILAGCESDFRTRFCAEEFEALGTLQISPLEDRMVTIYEGTDSEHCANLLWVRVLSLGDVGPVREPGTLFQLPVIADIEVGAGRVHGVAFPSATLRVDEVGVLDEHQGPAPATCDSLGRAPR